MSHDRLSMSINSRRSGRIASPTRRSDSSLASALRYPVRCGSPDELRTGYATAGSIWSCSFSARPTCSTRLSGGGEEELPSQLLDRAAAERLGDASAHGLRLPRWSRSYEREKNLTIEHAENTKRKDMMETIQFCDLISLQALCGLCG